MKQYKKKIIVLFIVIISLGWYKEKEIYYIFWGNMYVKTQSLTYHRADTRLTSPLLDL